MVYHRGADRPHTPVATVDALVYSPEELIATPPLVARARWWHHGTEHTLPREEADALVRRPGFSIVGAGTAPPAKQP